MNYFWPIVALLALASLFTAAGALEKIATYLERMDHRALQRDHAFNMAKSQLDAEEELRRADS